MGKRVLIIGCGEIGSRHLQAVASLPEISEIEVIDARPAALELGRARIEEITDRQAHIEFRWLKFLDEAHESGDLCIIATRADARRQIMSEVTDRTDYRHFLLEKLVTQSVADYEALMRIADERKLSVWVNCKSRVHPSHARVKSKLDPGEPFSLSSIGGNHGLVNNGVHFIDLFVFYDDAREVTPALVRIDPILHRTKRGLFDLSGTLGGYTEKGSSFTLTFAAEHTAPSVFSICSPRYRAVIDDNTKRFFESSIERGWNWQEVPMDANLSISYMTKAFASDILKQGSCRLPTLQDCYPAHAFILTQLKPHFEKLMGVSVEHCPAT
jgi:predicted dehydrogenase